MATSDISVTAAATAVSSTAVGIGRPVCSMPRARPCDGADQRRWGIRISEGAHFGLPDADHVTAVAATNGHGTNSDN